MEFEVVYALCAADLHLLSSNPVETVASLNCCLESVGLVESQ